MNNKQPYLREVSLWESRRKYASTKSVIEKKKQKKKLGQVQRKRQIVVDQNNNRLRDAILEKIEQNEHHYCGRYDSTIDKIKVKITFSKSYTLNMTLPSTMRLSELHLLIGCYIKLHLKHRPTERHVYGGLESQWDHSNIKRMQELQVLEEQQQQLLRQQKLFQQQHEPLCRLTSKVVTYITDSILLSHTRLQQEWKSLLQTSPQQTLFGTLNEIVVGHRLAGNKGNQQTNNQLSLLVKYHNCFINDAEYSVSTIPLQNNQLFTLDPDQHNSTKQQIKTISPKYPLIHTPSHHKQISFSSPNSQLMKWFVETNIVEWLVVYQHIMDNNTACENNHINKKGKHFINPPISWQHKSKLSFQTIIPVGLIHNHNTKSIYHLAIIDWHNYETKQISQKIKQITKCLIQSDLPLTHRVKEMYSITKIVGQVENHSNSFQSSQIFVSVFETLHLRTITLKEYLRQLLNRLISRKSKGCINQKRVCQCIRNDDSYYHIDQCFSNDSQQQIHYLQKEVKRILTTVKSLCLRITVLMRCTQNNNNIYNLSTQSIHLSQVQSILDIFHINIHQSTITQVLMNSLAITKLICNHHFDHGILLNNKGKSDNHRSCNGNGVDESLTYNMGIQSDKQEQNISLFIFQRLNQQILTLVKELNTQNQQYLSKLLTQSLLSPFNTHTIYPTTLYEQCNNWDYLKLIINSLRQSSQKFLQQLSSRQIIDRNHNRRNNLSLQQKYDAFVQYSLQQSQQQLSIFRKFIHNHHSTIKIDCLYSKPQVNTFLHHQNIDIHEKQTTLKKKYQTSPYSYHLNTKPNHSPLSKQKQLKVIATNESYSYSNFHNNKNYNISEKDNKLAIIPIKSIKSKTYRATKRQKKLKRSQAMAIE